MARPDDERPGSGSHWVKSSLSFSNGNCVEVANLSEGGVAVRNSRDPEGPVLRFTPDEWRAFIGDARLGEFDSFGKQYSHRGSPQNYASSAAAGRDKAPNWSSAKISRRLSRTRRRKDGSAMKDERFLLLAGVIVALAGFALTAYVVTSIGAEEPMVDTGVLTALAAVLAAIPPIIRALRGGKQ